VELLAPALPFESSDVMSSRPQRLLFLPLPVLMAAYGVYCIVRQEAIIGRHVIAGPRGVQVAFFGWGAVAFGLTCISFGAVIFHLLFWDDDNHPMPSMARRTALLSGLTLAGSIVAVVLYYLRDFR